MLSFDYNVLDRLLLLDVSDGLWSSFSSCPPSNPRLPASSWFWKPITHNILSANSSLTCFVWYRLIIQENTRILVIQRKGVPGKKILQSPPNIYQEGTKYLFCLIRYKKPHWNWTLESLSQESGRKKRCSPIYHTDVAFPSSWFQMCRLWSYLQRLWWLMWTKTHEKKQCLQGLID